MHTCVSCAAFTAVAVNQLDAIVGSVWVTGVRQALIYITLTSLTHIAWWAHAPVATHPVHTAPAIKTAWLAGLGIHIRGTIVDINFTVNTYRVTERQLG